MKFTLAVLSVSAICAFAQQNPSTATQVPAANELVRIAVQNELKPESESQHFTYRDEKLKDNGTRETKQMISTSQGMMLGRIIAIDGKPLDAEQRHKEDLRLQRLLDDPSQLENKKKEQKEDEQRVRQMVGALPNAFVYEYVGSEQGKNGEIKVLQFHPNPNFDPPSRELQVYQGMEGTMKIAVPQNHIVLLHAKLFRQVNFGWGILGHLNSGGEFIIEQSEITPQHWDLTHMKLNFTGKALFFKTINIQEDERTSDYQEVPPLNLAQAIAKLKQADTEIAANGAAHSKH